MNAELAVQNILVSDSAFAAVVSDRVGYDETVQTELLPRVLVMGQGITPNDTKDGPSEFDQDKIFVYHMSNSKQQTSNMALLARTALERKSGTFNLVKVVSIRFLDQVSFTEQVVNNKIFTSEQIYQVITKP